MPVQAADDALPRERDVGLERGPAARQLVIPRFAAQLAEPAALVAKTAQADDPGALDWRALDLGGHSITSCWSRLGGARESAIGKGEQIPAIAVAAQRLRQPGELGAVDPALLEGDLLGARDLEALALLDGLDEVRGLMQRIVRARV